jgi:hypothetical protein
MGADWIRRTQDKYKHSLKEGTRRRLKVGPLFVPEEQETVTYPCHWLNESKTFPPDTRLTIFQSSDRARVAVMHGSQAVAEVRGEAARDLKELFRKHPQLQNARAVTVVRTGTPSESFYVQPCRPPKKGPKANQ